MKKNSSHDQSTIAVDFKEIAPIYGAILVFVYFGVIKHTFKFSRWFYEKEKMFQF